MAWYLGDPPKVVDNWNTPMKSQVQLVGSPTGHMAPIDVPVDWIRHNAHFFERRENKIVLDACGRPSEHVLECCTISIARDQLSEVCVPVDDTIRERFAAAYQRWKDGIETDEGTRLADWGETGMTARLVRDLGDMHIESVEDLAAVSDGHINKIVDGRAWRAKATSWVQAHPKPEEECKIQQLEKQNQMFVERLLKLEKQAKAPSPAMSRKMAQLRAKKAAKKPVINETPNA